MRVRVSPFRSHILPNSGSPNTPSTSDMTNASRTPPSRGNGSSHGRRGGRQGFIDSGVKNTARQHRHHHHNSQTLNTTTHRLKILCRTPYQYTVSKTHSQNTLSSHSLKTHSQHILNHRSSRMVQVLRPDRSAGKRRIR